MESLSEKTQQDPIMVFEGFVIRPFDGHNLFMENPYGEGTTIHKIHFLAMLSSLFKRNFD